MKLLNIFIVNFLLLGGLTLTTCNQAKAGELPQNQKVKAISTEIREKITFPDELVGKEIAEKVTVEFKRGLAQIIWVNLLCQNPDYTIEVPGYTSFSHKHFTFTPTLESPRFSGAFVFRLRWFFLSLKECFTEYLSFLYFQFACNKQVGPNCLILCCMIKLN